MSLSQNTSGCSLCKSFIPAILSGVAIVLGTAANVFCETLSFPQTGTDRSLDVSPYYYRTKNVYDVNGEPWVVNSCRNYNYLDRELGFQYDFDAKAKTVRAFAIITPIIGGIGLVYAFIAPCLPASPSRWQMLGCLFLSACLFQGLTLMIQSSSICTSNPVVQYLMATNPDAAATLQEDCEQDTGYILNIVSVVFWFLAGICVYVIPAPAPNFSEPPQTQTVTYQQNPDGTVEETNVAVVKGSPVDAEAIPEEAVKS